MSLETLLAAAEYLEWRSGVESRELPLTVGKEYQPYPSSPVKRSAYTATSSQPDAKSEDSEESGERKRWAGTREVHNKLEKNRRAHLKECFELLRQEIPSIDDRKISNLSILQKALRYVQAITAKEKELEDEKKRLAALGSVMHSKLARLKQEVKAMDVLDDVDTWLASQQETADCSTSTASECCNEEESFEENAIKAGSRGLRKSWKTEASWPLTNGKVELKVLRVPQQQPALQRMQHAAVRATLQQRLHMRVNADAATVATAPYPTADKASSLAAITCSETVPAMTSAVAVPAQPSGLLPTSVPAPAVSSATAPPLSFDHSGDHSLALIRAARAAGHPSVRGLSTASSSRPDGALAVPTTCHNVLISSSALPQQQQQPQLFLLPASASCGTSALAAAAAAASTLPSSTAAASSAPTAGLIAATKRVLAPLQPVAVSAAAAVQPLVSTNLVFPAQPSVYCHAPAGSAAAAAAAFPFFLAGLTSFSPALSLVPCHVPIRDQQLKAAGPGGSSNGIVAHSAAGLPASTAGDSGAMRVASSSFRPVGHSTATSGLVPVTSSSVLPSDTAAGMLRSAGAASSAAAAVAASLHLQQSPQSPLLPLAKQAPLHIVTAPQQYVLMMATAATQDHSNATMSVAPVSRAGQPEPRDGVPKQP